MRVLPLVFVFLSSTLVLADTSPPTPGRKLSVTIYPNRALIEDVRTGPIGKGRRRLEFANVSGQIQPETATLTGADISIVEQNFDFDLLTPGKMMEKAVGSTVTIVRTNPTTGREKKDDAEVLSTNEGVVLKVGDHIEVLRDDGLPTRVLFEQIPPNLRAKPTLSVMVNSTKASIRPVTLRYLTGGLTWNANYVGVYDDKAKKLDLQGWITLTNTSGAPYPNARIKLVAGNISNWFSSVWNTTEAGTEKSDPEKTVGDYHIYRLKYLTTIAENQTKQASFLSAQGASAKKVYVLESNSFWTAEEPENAGVVIEFSNSKASRLGAPLPAGTVRLYAKDNTGQAQFIGEDKLNHTPQGSLVALNVGKAFDVTMKSQVVDRKSEGTKVFVTEMAYTFRNARTQPVVVRFSQNDILETHKWLSRSLDPKKKSPTSYQWNISVPANGEAILTFKIREETPAKPKS